MDPIIQRVCEMFDQATFKTCGSFLLGVLGWLLGGFDIPFRALTILFVGDYALGFGLAIYRHKFSFVRARQGVGKFLLYAFAVMMANIFDQASAGAIPWLDHPARDFMICYLAVNEFLSVSVHLAAMGVRMPVWLISRIQRFRDVADGKCEEVLDD